MDISISKIKPVDQHGQQHCRVLLKRAFNGVPPDTYENFCIDPGDPHGLSPLVRWMIATGKTRANLKDFENVEP